MQISSKVGKKMTLKMPQFGCFLDCGEEIKTIPIAERMLLLSFFMGQVQKDLTLRGKI